MDLFQFVDYETIIFGVNVPFGDSYSDTIHLVDVFGEVYDVDFAEFVDFFTIFVDNIPFIPDM